MRALKVIYSLIGTIFYQDKRIAKRLPDYFPTYRSLLGEFMNQFLRYIGSSRSFRPQGIIIEPTNYCNLRCAHCTTQAIDEEKGYMDYDLYRRILDTNPQITCLILTRNGEPFLHPKIVDMIAYAKNKNIYVSIYTNGILLSKEKADSMLNIGLDEINFSLEGVDEEYEKNKGVPYKMLKENVDYLIKKRDLLKSRLRIGANIARIRDDDDNIKAIIDAWKGRYDHVHIEPLMGKRSSPRRTTCRTLWRNAVVRWDGVVLPCCVDMEATLVMGDVRVNALKEIFNSDKAIAIRKSHLERRYPPVCKYCDILFG